MNENIITASGLLGCVVLFVFLYICFTNREKTQCKEQTKTELSRETKEVFPYGTSMDDVNKLNSESKQKTNQNEKA